MTSVATPNPDEAMKSGPSLCVATWLGKAMTIAFGSRLILARFSSISATWSSLLDTTVIDDHQQIRAVAFLEIPDGPVCIVTAGDDKMIHLYNISSSEENQSHTQEYTTPCYTYGPHSKRITHLATNNSEGTIIFGDKFGEVYRLRLQWTPEHKVEAEGSASNPATLLLQHFSIFTCIFLSSPVLHSGQVAGERANSFSRRLFTCDKDCHARASRFPNTFSIEQFLWPKEQSPSVVTIIAEIPPLSGTASHGAKPGATTAEGGMKEPLKSAEAEDWGGINYYVFGHHNGSITFWAAKNDVTDESNNTPFSLISTVQHPENAGGVVGLCYAAATRDSQGHTRHADDTPRGVFVARDGSDEIVFIPVLSTGRHQLFVASTRMQRVRLPHPVVALRRCTSTTAVALTRAGTIHFVELLSGPGLNAEQSIESQQWDVTLRDDLQMLDMQGAVQRYFCAAESGETVEASEMTTETPPTLPSVNLWEQWQNEAVDPRTRRKRQHEDGEDEKSGEDQS